MKTRRFPARRDPKAAKRTSDVRRQETPSQFVERLAYGFYLLSLSY